ncbi:hypothetical protein B7486_55335, partial [cyanobacterium TDX16]
MGRSAGAAIEELALAAGPGDVPRSRAGSPKATWPLPGRDPADGVGLALSGGGFRATLAGAGTIRALADVGLLSSVQYVSSVSGGSITNGALARAWPTLEQQAFTSASVDEHLVTPLVERISGASLKWKVVRNIWRAVPPGTTRTHVLANALDDWFFEGMALSALPDDCRWAINAANLTTGTRFVFDREVVGDYVSGYRPAAGSGLRVADAVAA